MKFIETFLSCSDINTDTDDNVIHAGSLEKIAKPPSAYDYILNDKKIISIVK